MESLLADSCGRCGGAQCDVTCVVCKIPFHKRCVQKVSVWMSREIVCDDCTDNSNTTGQSLNQTIHSQSGAIRKSSFRPGQLQGNSTASVPVEDYQELKRKLHEMERMVRRLTCGPQQQFESLKATPVHSVLTGIVDRNESQMGKYSAQLSSSSWRTQVERLNDALGLNRTVALTKEQRDNRKSLDTNLPPFNGDPCQWVTFITAYAQTTDSCGFDFAENRARLEKCLSGDAKNLVRDKLRHPRHVEDVMQRLEQMYGKPAILMTAMSKKVEKMDRLLDDLSNLAEFLGNVEDVQDVFTITQKDSSDTELFRNIEQLLPIVYAREWHREKKQLGNNLKGLVRYLNTLFDEAIEIGVSVIRKTTVHKKKSMDTQSSHRVLLATVEQSDQCPLKCASVHDLEVCPRFLQLDSRGRWNGVKKWNRCRMCFGSHFVNECPRRSKCGIDGCPGLHHRLLHFTKPKSVVSQKEMEVNRPARKVIPQNEIEVHRPLMMIQQPAETHHRVVPVRITSGSQSMNIWAFWDAGSAMTIITKNLAERMNLSGPRSTIPLQWTDEEIKQRIDSEMVTMTIEPIGGGERYIINAQTMEKLCLPKGTVTAEELQKEELNVPVHINSDVQPELLIGQDNAVVLRTLRSVLGKSGQIVASETPFGWVIEGRAGITGARRVLSINHIKDPLETLVEEYIENDNHGLIDNKDVLYESDQCLAARKLMKDDTVYKNSRFETGLLWMDRNIMLPDNKEGALQRHVKFEQKLRKQPDLWARVDAMMEMYKAKKYIRPAQGEGNKGHTWYLPIFTVINPAKPEKLRVVWDAAAKFHGVCLNDVLMSGPDLTSPLVNVLLRFRAGEYAVTGDIEEMFHRIIVQEKDRCAQRFFWRRSPDAPIVIYEMCVLIFGATCSPALAQFAKNMNADRMTALNPRVAAAIKENYYVDDFLQSEDDEQHLADLAVAVRDAHSSGGFNIHKWESNSQVVLTALGAPRSSGSREVSQFHSCSVLGMIWNTTNDLFSFRLRRDKLTPGLLDGTANPTKRMALSTAMSLYDPLGLLTYKTLEIKLILRESWRMKVSWDEELPEVLTRRWNTWGGKAEELENIHIPRWLGTRIGDPVELHVFSDASENAICAVAYIVQRSSGARMMCFAKSRVSSLKAKSIPRLELDAATLGVRVLKIIQNASAWQNISRVVMWTDARDVLYWLRSAERRYTVYVANRVSTILSATSVENWRWVPTEQNPADMGTKNCKDKTPELWWKGPSFLAEDEDSRPNCFERPKEELEVRRVALVQTLTRDPIVPNLDTASISSWIKWIRATARVRSAAYVLCKRIKTALDPSAEDEAWAEKLVLKVIQKESKVAELKKFSPFLDEDGIWRARTRVVKGEFDRETKCPIILSDHAGTRLLIQHYHHFGGHQNFYRTINEVRRRFIIPRLRTLANKVVKACRTCIVLNSRPLVPEMAALPRCRLAVNHAAFAYTGIDCFGPIDVIKFRRHEKRWGILFTCLTTRAVYIEVITSMSAVACVAAIESFVTRRSLPVQFRSDNGTNFVAAANLYRGPNGERINWLFNPPGCPHMGGAWERLIGVTKRSLRKMDFTKIKTEEELRRALIRAEYIVNTRPITEYPVDEDTLECLTPQHILEGRRTRPARNNLMEEDVESFKPTVAMKQREEVVQQFWDRWTKEYLPSLQRREKWLKKQDCLKPGDVVYICDSDVREGWRRGVVEKVWQDVESEQVRQVTVRAADGKLYRRGAAHLARIA